MSVLPDYYIKELCETPDRGNEPLVQPFDENQLQPASYDVRLGDEFIVFEPHDETHVDLEDPQVTTKRVKAHGPNGFVLHPGEFVLGHTDEIICLPDNIVARIEGKSSVGRLGLIVHATAGYIDPGFKGRITLEMTNLLRTPICLRPGRLIGQFSFQYLAAAALKPYNGRYQGDTSVTESRYGVANPAPYVPLDEAKATFGVGQFRLPDAVKPETQPVWREDDVDLSDGRRLAEEARIIPPREVPDEDLLDEKTLAGIKGRTQ